LDGINIENFEKTAYQKMFGVIFQDFIKYEFTVKENIAVGSIGDLEDLDKINEAAENSLANEVVDGLKDGYAQQLGKRFARGTDLSGGQWQKIALARAYMKAAAVMILDEPTSALDARAEYEAFQRFMGLTENKTSSCMRSCLVCRRWVIGRCLLVYIYIIPSFEKSSKCSIFKSK